MFQSGDASVDLTFRDPILAQSADHYSVGVDELTVSLGSLSMLEYNKANPSVLLRVKLRGVDGATDYGNVDGARDWLMPDGPIGNVEQWRRGFQFSVDKAYTNLNQILKRFDEISSAVNDYIEDVGLINPNPLIAGPYYTAAYVFAANASVHHLQIMLNSNGSIEIAGTRTFFPFGRLFSGPYDGLVSVESAHAPDGLADRAVVPKTHAMMMMSPLVIGLTIRFLRTGQFAEPGNA